MIEFKDVTGDVIGRPGESFFKMDSISDEAIAEYLGRGAVIVHIDDLSHAHALKLRTAKELFDAKQALSKVPDEELTESVTISRVREGRQAAVETAQGADDRAEEAVTKAKSKPKATKPKKGKK